MGEETFTLGEMHAAFQKSLRGETLTRKEQELSDAKRAAIRADVRSLYIHGDTTTHGENIEAFGRRD